jgi:hypothetical protein
MFDIGCAISELRSDHAFFVEDVPGYKDDAPCWNLQPESARMDNHKSKSSLLKLKLLRHIQFLLFIPSLLLTEQQALRE